VPTLSSRAIAAAEYDIETQTLQLWFHGSGGPYDYPGVPPSLYEGLLSASSAGSFYNAHIRYQYGGVGHRVAPAPRRPKRLF